MNPFDDLQNDLQNDLQEEIEGVFQWLSGESEDDELRTVIQQQHENLLQRIGNRVQQTLQVQEDIEGIIDGLTNESMEIDNTFFQTRIEQLKETLQTVKQNKMLTSQMKTNASFLLTTQEHTRELRKTSHELRKALQQAPPKGTRASSDILTGGTIFCKALGGLRFN